MFITEHGHEKMKILLQNRHNVEHRDTTDMLKNC